LNDPADTGSGQHYFIHYDAKPKMLIKSLKCASMLCIRSRNMVRISPPCDHSHVMRRCWLVPNFLAAVIYRGSHDHVFMAHSHEVFAVDLITNDAVQFEIGRINYRAGAGDPVVIGTHQIHAPGRRSPHDGRCEARTFLLILRQDTVRRSNRERPFPSQIRLSPATPRRSCSSWIYTAAWRAANRKRIRLTIATPLFLCFMPTWAPSDHKHTFASPAILSLNGRGT
jgi:hypothetical protein